MKKVLNFLFLALFFIFGYGLYLYMQPEVGIPNFLIQMSVNKKFPIEKSYAVGKLKLSHPKTTINGNMLIIEAKYKNQAVGDNISGTMTFQTHIKYDSFDSKLYLDKFELVNVTKDGKEIDMQKHPVIRTALKASFKRLEKEPILDLDDFSFVEDIKISDGKFIVYK